MTHFLKSVRQISILCLSMTTLALTSVAWSQDSSTPIEMSLGNPDSTVVLTEYASFTCPHCASFHRDVYPSLKKNYIDTGKIHFRLREVYFDAPGLWAGILARCGGEEKYFSIVDLLFDKQQSWSGQASPNEIVMRLLEIGRAAGLSNEAMGACFSDANKAQALVDVWEMNKDADKIRGTPSLIINGTLHSNMSYERLAELLDEELSN